MSTKQKGTCPFCRELINATVVEENTVRRDKCECPSCKETIYTCRSPGCHDYAKGTDVYDHELCPTCTTTVADAAGSVGSLAGKAALVVVGAVASAAASAHFKK